MWNMKNKTSEQTEPNRNRVIDAEKREGEGRRREIVEGD